MARELCGLVGVRNYHAQTVVSTVGGLGSRILAAGGAGQLTLRVDTDTAQLVVAASVPADACSEADLRRLAKAAHHVDCRVTGLERRAIAAFDYELLRQ